MNIIIREWKFYRRQIGYWTIGLFLLLFIAFYKMNGLTNTQGGLESVLKSLPPVLQAFFGSMGNVGDGIGTYQMIHLYLAIALALHAVILGSHIFAKEEFDKTFEFLYVKGVKRAWILFDKMFAGIIILLFLNIISMVGIWSCVMIMKMDLHVSQLLPYLGSLFMMQVFFFSMALLISLFLKKHHIASIVSCSIVFVMFMFTMYEKMGGSLDILEKLSMFHYTDASYIQSHEILGIPLLMIVCIIVLSFVVSYKLHEHRDLL